MNVGSPALKIFNVVTAVVVLVGGNAKFVLLKKDLLLLHSSSQSNKEEHIRYVLRKIEYDYLLILSIITGWRF